MEENVKFVYIEKGAYAPREGVPFVRRENIAAVLKYRDEYMLLSWNEVDYEKSLVTGGIENDEDRIVALKREVIEETGYYDFKSINEIDCVNISKFFVEHKNQNREAIYYPYLVELASLDRQSIMENEKKEHTCVWFKEQELEEVNIFDNHRMMLKSAIDYVKNK